MAQQFNKLMQSILTIEFKFSHFLFNMNAQAQKGANEPFPLFYNPESKQFYLYIVKALFLK